LFVCQSGSVPSLNPLKSVDQDLSNILLGYIAQSSLYYQRRDFSTGSSFCFMMGPLKQPDLFWLYIYILNIIGILNPDELSQRLHSHLTISDFGEHRSLLYSQGLIEYANVVVT
jgi:hypothetical protein